MVEISGNIWDYLGNIWDHLGTLIRLDGNTQSYMSGWIGSLKHSHTRAPLCGANKQMFKYIGNIFYTILYGTMRNGRGYLAGGEMEQEAGGFWS